jgi:hypothetical protein
MARIVARRRRDEASCYPFEQALAETLWVSSDHGGRRRYHSGRGIAKTMDAGTEPNAGADFKSHSNCDSDIHLDADFRFESNPIAHADCDADSVGDTHTVPDSNSGIEPDSGRHPKPSFKSCCDPNSRFDPEFNSDPNKATTGKPEPVYTRTEIPDSSKVPALYSVQLLRSHQELSTF